jgi:hypothetical protein
MSPVNMTGNTITDSTVTISTTKTLQEIWSEQITSIRSEIQTNFINDVRLRREMLCSLHEIEAHFTQNEEINSLLKQINCDIKKNEVANGITISRIVHFYIVGKVIDNAISLPNRENNKLTIKSLDTWLFNSANSSDISIGMHIGSIADFITSNQKLNISNGIAFICQLLNNGGLNCQHCRDGELNVDNKLKKILPNFLNKNPGVRLDNKQQYDDFFNLQTKQEIKFVCGNCMTNINNLENAKKIL